MARRLENTAGDIDPSKQSNDRCVSSRRRVLKSMGTAGALPLSIRSSKNGTIDLSPNPDRKEVAIDKVYESPEIEKLKSEFPDLTVDSESVQSVIQDNDSQITSIRISVTDGLLTYINTNQVTQVILALDDDARSSIEDWPPYTEGFIRASAEEAVFTRTATQLEQLLVSYRLGQTQMENPTNTNISFTPESGTYYIDKYDEREKEIESIIATTAGPSIQNTSGSGSGGLSIRSQAYYGENDMSLSDTEECELNGAAAGDIFFCLVQATTCALCAPSVVGGPKAALACLLLVCLGSPTAVQAVIPELENNCYNLAERAYTCFKEFSKFYDPMPLGPFQETPKLHGLN